MSSTPQSREELLASLSCITKRTLICTENSFDTFHASTIRSPCPPPKSVCLPRPPPLLAPLLEAGAPQGLAKEMHTFYLQRAEKLRTRYTAVISRLRTNLPRLPIDGFDTSSDQLTSLFLRLYIKSLQDWVRHEVDMFRVRRLPTHKKPFNQAFNHDYVPILEQFFNENPFPTHADKAALAKRSGMSYQQINVWFQNRRTRSRKMRKVLPKQPMSEATTLPHAGPVVCRYYCATNCGEANVNETCDDLLTSDPLDQSRDQCALGSLSRLAQTGVRFDPSWWPRRPSLAIPRRSSFDMDGLVEKLSQLSVRDRTSGRSKKYQHGLRYPLASTLSITLMPPRAPHPALIRGQYVSPPPPPPLIVPRTSVSRSTRLRAFNASNRLPALNLLATSVSDVLESPRKRLKVMSQNPSLGVTSSGKSSTFDRSVTSSPVPQVTSHLIPTLSTNTIDHVLQKNRSPWDFPFGHRATVRLPSQHATPPWDFRSAVSV